MGPGECLTTGNHHFLSLLLVVLLARCPRRGPPPTATPAAGLGRQAGSRKLQHPAGGRTWLNATEPGGGRLPWPRASDHDVPSAWGRGTGRPHITNPSAHGHDYALSHPQRKSPSPSLASRRNHGLPEPEGISAPGKLRSSAHLGWGGGREQAGVTGAGAGQAEPEAGEGRGPHTFHAPRRAWRAPTSPHTVAQVSSAGLAGGGSLGPSGPPLSECPAAESDLLEGPSERSP